MADSEQQVNQRERQKCLQLVTRKLVYCTGTCIIILLIFFYGILPFLELKQTYLVVYVFASGLVGGFVSIQQRLPKIALNELRELSNSWLSILLIPLNGGIFAVILMLMFISGIIEGTLFPVYPESMVIEHQDLDDLVTKFTNWLQTTFPKTGADIAKLLFWSFVAGFSERFVPQIIRKTTDDPDS
jgi:hypothetical protein